jgi:hypothetical protein
VLVDEQLQQESIEVSLSAQPGMKSPMPPQKTPRNGGCGRTSMDEFFSWVSGSAGQRVSERMPPVILTDALAPKSVGVIVLTIRTTSLNFYIEGFCGPGNPQKPPSSVYWLLKCRCPPPLPR